MRMKSVEWGCIMVDLYDTQLILWIEAAVNVIER